MGLSYHKMRGSKITNLWRWNIFGEPIIFLSSIYDIGSWWYLILCLYWILPRYRSERSTNFIMTTYIDRVRKKILSGSTLSYLLLKLRAIKVDISVSKEPLWTDQIMLIPLCFSCQKQYVYSGMNVPLFVIGIIGKYI